MNNENNILTILESIQNQIIRMEKNRNDRFDTMDNRFDAMKKFIAKEIQSTRDELKIEIQHVYEEVKEIKEDFNNIEQITAKNWLDISR